MADPTPPTTPSFDQKLKAAWDKVHTYVALHPMFTSGAVAFVLGFILAKCTG